jgi:hypothetical protein
MCGRFCVCRTGSKIPRGLCWVLGQQFDAIAEVSELPGHSRRACWFGTLLDGRAVFRIADPAMQNDPDESTDAMGNRPDGLIVSQAGYQSAI